MDYKIFLQSLSWDEFKTYESMFIDNFYAIERNGLHVDYNIFTDSFKTNLG